jgi:hypothetical protein
MVFDINLGEMNGSWCQCSCDSCTSKIKIEDNDTVVQHMIIVNRGGHYYDIESGVMNGWWGYDCVSFIHITLLFPGKLLYPLFFVLYIITLFL